MSENSQSYSNHRRYHAPFHFFVLPVLLANSLIALRLAVRSPGASSIWAAVVAFAIVFGLFLARGHALAVQDRVIRFEERIRLERLLPAELQEAIPLLTRRQLVAIRFASDAELPQLVRRVQSGEFTHGNEIKQAVKEWRPDLLRA
jgi:hypothetical protein